MPLRIRLNLMVFRVANLYKYGYLTRNEAQTAMRNLGDMLDRLA
jgi:hypothetical protein